MMPPSPFASWLGIFFGRHTRRLHAALAASHGITAEQLELLVKSDRSCGGARSADINHTPEPALRGLLLKTCRVVWSAMEGSPTSRNPAMYNSPQHHRQPLPIYPEEIVAPARWCRPSRIALFCADCPRNLPASSTCRRGAPDTFLLHNDLASLPAQSRRPARFTVMWALPAQRNELPSPRVWLEPTSARFRPGGLRHFEQWRQPQAAQQEPAMY